MLHISALDFRYYDLNMRGMFRFLDLLCGLQGNSNLTHIPWLMLTADAQREQIIAAAQAG